MLPARDRLTRASWNIVKTHTPTKKGYNTIGTLHIYKVNIGFGCSVACSKKYQKKAVARNKLKRQLYSIFRTSVYRKDYTYTFFPSKYAYTADFKTINTLLNELLKTYS